MKIALCISGELRTFNHPAVKEYFKKYIIEPLNPDMFLSTWDHIGVSVHQENNFHELSKDVLLDDIKECYPDLKKLNIENFNEWMANGSNINLKELYLEWKRVGNISRYNGGFASSVPQLYKIYDSKKLKCDYETENGFKYDIVLRVRPDLLFVNSIDTNIKQNTIYHNNFGPRGWHWPNRIYDIFFYSDSSTFDKISDSWLNLESLFNDSWDNGCGRLDACRTLYLQSVRDGINVESINKRFCEVYRNVNVDEFIKEIKQYD